MTLRKSRPSLSRQSVSDWKLKLQSLCAGQSSDPGGPGKVSIPRPPAKSLAPGMKLLQDILAERLVVLLVARDSVLNGGWLPPTDASVGQPNC